MEYKSSYVLFTSFVVIFLSLLLLFASLKVLSCAIADDVAAFLLKVVYADWLLYMKFLTYCCVFPSIITVSRKSYFHFWLL